MTISASLVMELRKATDCGMMDCKKALTEADGDMEKAIEILRTKGMSKAAKKADRVAAEGVIVVKASDDGKAAVMLEVNSETDFVARDENFLGFVAMISDAALENRTAAAESLHEVIVKDGKTVEVVRQELVAKIGENVNLRRAAFLADSGHVGFYAHGNQRIGVLVAIDKNDEELAKDVAMHIAASKPQFVSPDQVSSDVVEKEKAIFIAQAKESGKPDNIIEKMVVGRVNKFLNEISLTGQPFVKNPDITVGQLLKEKGCSVQSFVRYELGEGIEKKEENFAEEVMAQVKGSE